jgi:hypothetical protein
VTESGIKLVLWAAAAALTGAMLAIPQPVDPWEMPSLVLSRKAVGEAVRQNERLAATLSEGEEVERLRSLFIGHGLAEANPPYSKVDYDSRRADFYRAIKALEEEHGREALGAVRARAIEDFMRIFGDGTRKLESDDDVGAVGGFREILERYGAISQAVLIAPEMTVRALYKARWNLIHRRQATDGFSEIELQAYWGWLALHGWGVPLAERRNALVEYRNAGGANAREALALFELLERRPETAAKLLEALYSEDRELRLRNLALGAFHAASAPQR